MRVRVMGKRKAEERGVKRVGKMAKRGIVSTHNNFEIASSSCSPVISYSHTKFSTGHYLTTSITLHACPCLD